MPRSWFACLTLSLWLILLPGCAAWRAYTQRTAITQVEYALEGVEVAGLDLVGIHLVVRLSLQNPTATPIELDRLTYVLYVDENRACEGTTSAHQAIPPGQKRTLPVAVTLHYADLKTQMRQLLMRREVASWRLEGTAWFETPFGPLEYPVRVRRGTEGT